MQEQKESIEDFYRFYTQHSNNPALKEHGQFNVFRRSEIDWNFKSYKPYNRRDYYKVALIDGKGKLYYSGKTIEVNQPALLFSNPNIPYAWESVAELQAGYFCLFTEEFIDPVAESETLRKSPLFQMDTRRVFFPDKHQMAYITSLFERMITELSTDYSHKYDLIRSLVELVTHEALKIEPVEQHTLQADASSRITIRFFHLLERQFPVSFENILQLKSAKDFATSLAIHTNHLNRAVKKITGKTTTEHIALRILQEAKALLKHSDWSIGDIAFCLGFESPAYFNNFFKKYSTISPGAYRQ